MQQLRRGGGGGRGHPRCYRPRPATHAEHGVSSSIASSASRVPLPLPPTAVNSSGFQIRIDSKMAPRRYYIIMNAPRLFLPSFPFVTPRGLFCPNYVEGRLTREGVRRARSPKYGRAGGQSSLSLLGDEGGEDREGTEGEQGRKASPRGTRS